MASTSSRRSENRRQRHDSTTINRSNDEEDISDFFRSLGLHVRQREAAIRSCLRQLVLTVGDLRLVARQEEGGGGLRELFPQLGVRARVQAWYNEDIRRTAVAASEPVTAARRPVEGLQARPTNDDTDRHTRTSTRAGSGAGQSQPASAVAGRGGAHHEQPTNNDTRVGTGSTASVSAASAGAGACGAEAVTTVAYNGDDGAPSNSISVIIEDLIQQSRRFIVAPTETVGHLKEMVAEKVHPWGLFSSDDNRFELILDLGFKKLKDMSQTLEQCGVQTGSKIHLMPQFRNQTDDARYRHEHRRELQELLLSDDDNDFYRCARIDSILI